MLVHFTEQTMQCDAHTAGVEEEKCMGNYGVLLVESVGDRCCIRETVAALLWEQIGAPVLLHHSFLTFSPLVKAREAGRLRLQHIVFVTTRRRSSESDLGVVCREAGERQ